MWVRNSWILLLIHCCRLLYTPLITALTHTCTESLTLFCKQLPLTVWQAWNDQMFSLLCVLLTEAQTSGFDGKAFTQWIKQISLLLNKTAASSLELQLMGVMSVAGHGCGSMHIKSEEVENSISSAFLKLLGGGGGRRREGGLHNIYTISCMSCTISETPWIGFPRALRELFISSLNCDVSWEGQLCVRWIF